MAEVRAEALIGLCRDGAGAKAPGRVALNLHIDLDELRSENGFRPRAWTGADDITENTLWGLLAGAEVRPVFCQGGTPLSYGRSRRLAPDILRTILTFRDRECVVPHCTAPHPWLDDHHLAYWENSGTTDPDNLTGVCGFHHRGNHQNIWRIIPDDDSGEIETWRPDGSLVDPRPTWVTHTQPTHPEAVAIRHRIDDLAARRRKRRRAA